MEARLSLTLLTAFFWATLKTSEPENAPPQWIYVAYMGCALVSMHVAVACLGASVYAVFKPDIPLRFQTNLLGVAFLLWTLNHFLHTITQFWPIGTFLPTHHTMRLVTLVHVLAHVSLVWGLLPWYVLTTVTT